MVRLAAIVGVAVVSAFAQESPSLSREERVREQWAAMDEPERAEFRQRLEELRRLPADQRELLEERARELEQRMAELRDELPPELRRRLAELEPRRRHRILEEYLIERERARGKRLRAHFPPEFVERLEEAPPERRGALLRELHEELRRRAAARMIDELRHGAGLSPAEVERLEGLPGRERMRAVLESRRAHLRERIGRHGPPLDVSEEEWVELDGLPLEEFFRRWGSRRALRARALHPDAVRPGEFDARRPPLDPSSRWVHRGTLLDELAELARPTLDDLLELSELGARERRAIVSERVRERCLEFLDTHPLLDPEQLERLSELSDLRFVDELRAVIGRMSVPHGPGSARGPRPHGPPSSRGPGRERSGPRR